MSQVTAARELARKLIDFVNASPSPFHAVEAARQRLEGAGYARLSERNSWKDAIKPNGKYYFTRGGTSIVAFAVGGEWKSNNGIRMVAAHTDSPNLRVKPNSAVTDEGYEQVSVSTYGGGLWHTWFDRDLTIAGRLVLRGPDGTASAKLVNVEKPILRVPTLCIHLTAADDRAAFKVNTERHITPILCTSILKELTQPTGEAPTTTTAEDATNVLRSPHKHHTVLLELLAQKAGVNPDDILDFSLSLADAQPATIGGALDEFVFAPRLDNLASSFSAVEALLASDATLASDPQVRAIALFDHEEVGSESTAGAGSTHVAAMVNRLFSSVLDSARGEYDVGLANSFIVSADMAHAVHPCYKDRHHSLHKPELHKGVVVKYHANQRYATTDFTASLIQRLAEKHRVPLQYFTTGNDIPCGSTIGPIMSTKLGVHTVDIGAPQLSMHSIRETMGVVDVLHYTNLMKAFFDDFHNINTQDFDA